MNSAESQDPRPIDTTARIALALSGGGFRATLFHLGAIRHLRDQGLLSRVTHISSVSGGSIIGAHLVHRWRDYSKGNFDEAAEDLVAFVKKDLRGHVLRRALLEVTLGAIARIAMRHLHISWLRNWKPASTTKALSLRYELLYGKRSLTLTRELLRSPDAPPTAGKWWRTLATLLLGKRSAAESITSGGEIASLETEPPRLYVLATDIDGNPVALGPGEIWHTTHDPLTPDKKVFPRVPAPGTPMARAVAASSAFPGLFSPVKLDKQADCAIPPGVNFSPPPLVDGGVFDNSGVKMLSHIISTLPEAERPTHLVICDAGMPLAYQVAAFGEGLLDAIPSALRVADLLANQVDHTKSPEVLKLRPSTISIRHCQESALVGAPPLEFQALLQSIRTDLDAFSVVEVDLLTRHGYASAYAALMHTPTGCAEQHDETKRPECRPLASISSPTWAGEGSFHRVRAALLAGTRRSFLKFLVSSAQDPQAYLWACVALMLLGLAWLSAGQALYRRFVPINVDWRIEHMSCSPLDSGWSLTCGVEGTPSRASGVELAVFNSEGVEVARGEVAGVGSVALVVPHVHGGLVAQLRATKSITRVNSNPHVAIDLQETMILEAVEAAQRLRERLAQSRQPTADVSTDPNWADAWVASLQDWDAEVRQLRAVQAKLVRYGIGLSGTAQKEHEERLEVIESILAPQGALQLERVKVGARALYAQALLRGDDFRDSWAGAIASISSSAEYAGMPRLRPSYQLQPLGRNRQTGFWEFAHLLSGRRPTSGSDLEVKISEEDGIVLVLLPGGVSRQGAEFGDDETKPFCSRAARRNEAPVRRVRVAPFYVAKHEVTQSQWELLAGTNPSSFRRGLTREGASFTGVHPVENISWTSAVAGLRPVGLRLPSEAEWEYAARGESSTHETGSSWWTGNDPNELSRAGALEGEADGFRFHAPVGSFRENPFGLYDVIGNVFEWCSDAWSDDPAQPAVRDRSVHPLRGGCFGSMPADARSARRFGASAAFTYGLVGCRAAASVRLE